MAKTQFVNIPDEQKQDYMRALERRDRYILGVVQSAKAELSDRNKKKLKSESLFSFLAPYWRELTPEQKAIWRDAGKFSNITNWQLFISDNAARLRHDLPLTPPPSELWQVRAGKITIEAPADRILLKQIHPQTYVATRKIPGRPWARELVEIKENFLPPLDLEIRYKSDLVPIGPVQRARFFAEIWSSYQGEDIKTDVVLDFDPQSDWDLLKKRSDRILGAHIGYTLFLEITGYRGTILLDNIRAIHSGQNWARDPRFDEMDKEFKKAFSIVPPFWIPEELPEGANFDSVYPPSL